MKIDFDELAAVCKNGTLGGNCEAMEETEAVCQMDDPDFSQECDCCEEHCPLRQTSESVEPPVNSAAMVSAIVAHEKCGIAPTKVERHVEHLEWNIAIDNDHTATLTMSQDDFMALQQAVRQQPQHAITNRDCNAEMVGSNDAGIFGDDYEIGNK